MVDITKFQEDQQRLSESEKREASVQNLPQLLTSQHVTTLWEKMTRLYGHKWSSVSESDDGTWLDALRGLTPAQLGYGWRKMIDCGEYDWPPSAPEFRRLCVDVDQGALEHYIRRFAFKGIDSYSVGTMTQKEQDRRISQVRKPATAEFYNMAIAITAETAQLALEKKS